MQAWPDDVSLIGVATNAGRMSFVDLTQALFSQYPSDCIQRAGRCAGLKDDGTL